MKKVLLTSLQHLHELSEKGMHESDAFNQSLDNYLHAIKDADVSEKKAAIEFLEKCQCIGTLNISNMIESLEENLLIAA